MKKILLIEDEAPTLSVLADKLSHEGYEILTAQNGEEGLKTALENHPDIILTDIMMPRMGGIEVLERLRADEWGKDANIVVLSNLDDNEHIADSMESNVSGYIVKSNWKLEDIVDFVNKELS